MERIISQINLNDEEMLTINELEKRVMFSVITSINLQCSSGVCDKICDVICDKVCDEVCGNICDKICDVFCDRVYQCDTNFVCGSFCDRVVW